jgi:type II secretory pathway pseudopilin PulG
MFGASHNRLGERGIGLMEVIVATVIAVIAIVALAYSFGMGRGLVNQYEVARIALAAAQRRMETLAAAGLSSPDLALGPGFSTKTYGPMDVVVDGNVACGESWVIERFHDPANTTNPESTDLKKVTVTVSWGRAGPHETVALTRLFPLR